MIFLESVRLQPWVNHDSDIEIRYNTFSDIGTGERCVSMLHWHEYYELEFYVKGSASNTINGVCCPMTVGSLALLSPNDFHRLTTKVSEVGMRKLFFIPSALSGEAAKALTERGAPLVCRFEGEDFARVSERFDRLRDAFMKKDRGTALGLFRIRCAAEAILLEALEKAGEALPCGAPGEVVQRAVRTIHARLAEPISVAELAAEAYLSVDYFERLFRRATSLTVKEYVIEARMKRAACLLRETELPVSEAASASGYRSETLFYRHVKRTFGVTPAELRSRSKTDRLSENGKTNGTDNSPMPDG